MDITRKLYLLHNDGILSHHGACECGFCEKTGVSYCYSLINVDDFFSNSFDVTGLKREMEFYGNTEQEAIEKAMKHCDQNGLVAVKLNELVESRFKHFSHL